MRRGAIFHPPSIRSPPTQPHVGKARIGATADLVSCRVSAEDPRDRVYPRGAKRFRPRSFARESAQSSSSFAGEAETWVRPIRPLRLFRKISTRPAIDVPLLAQVVAGEPRVPRSLLGPDPRAPMGRSVTALGGQPNVRLHRAGGKGRAGPPGARLWDAFCWPIASTGRNRTSPSRTRTRSLEYFATGRVVVATYMSCHARPLICCCERSAGDSAAFPVPLSPGVMADLATHKQPTTGWRGAKRWAAGHGYGGADPADRTSARPRPTGHIEEGLPMNAARLLSGRACAGALLVRTRIHQIPGCPRPCSAGLWRGSGRGDSFAHRISAGPAKSLMFGVTPPPKLPEDKLYWARHWEAEVTGILARVLIYTVVTARFATTSAGTVAYYGRG